MFRRKKLFRLMKEELVRTTNKNLELEKTIKNNRVEYMLFIKTIIAMLEMSIKSLKEINPMVYTDIFDELFYILKREEDKLKKH